jgi:hypothetical protein
MNGSVVFLLCAVSFLTGGAFVHFFGATRSRVRVLEKALRNAAKRNVETLLSWGKERDTMRGESLIWKGIVEADSKRADRLYQQIAELQRINKTLYEESKAKKDSDT